MLRAKVDKDTEFTFYQNDGLVFGTYEGERIKEGNLIGYIEGCKFNVHYEHMNIDGEENSGNTDGRIEINNDGLIRIIDTWKWETKEGTENCIVQEIR